MRRLWDVTSLRSYLSGVWIERVTLVMQKVNIYMKTESLKKISWNNRIWKYI